MVQGGGTVASKECPQAPSLSISSLLRASSIFVFARIRHLGACSQAKNQRQTQRTQLTYNAESWKRAPSHIGERRVLSPFRHTCVPFLAFYHLSCDTREKNLIRMLNNARFTVEPVASHVVVFRRLVLPPPAGSNTSPLKTRGLRGRLQ